MKSVLVGSFIAVIGTLGMSNVAYAASASSVTAYCSSEGGFDQIDGFKGRLPANLCNLIKDAQLTPEKIDRALKKQPVLSKKVQTPRQLADRISKIYQRYVDEDMGSLLDGDDMVKAMEQKRAELFRTLGAAIG